MNYMPSLPYLRKYLKTLSREYKLIEHKLKVKVKKNIRCICKMYKQDVIQSQGLTQICLSSCKILYWLQLDPIFTSKLTNSK